MPKQTPNEPKHPGSRVEEARVAYRVPPGKSDPRATSAHVRLSSKNQITLPVGMLRVMGLKPGDELNLTQMNGKVLMSKRLYGQALLDSLVGSVKKPEWDTKEKIDEWLRIVREGGELP